MEIERISETPKELKFVLKDATLGFANLLRRYALSIVPVFAIEDVAVYENTSAFFDEYISHRLGLIPITTPAKTTKKEEVTLMLDAEGPAIIYSKDLKSSSKDVSVTNDKIPIIKLEEGQKVRIEAKAVLGTGKDHAKFQPGLTSYGYEEGSGFKFTIESFGQMAAKEILKRSLSQISDNAGEIEKLIAKKK